MTRTTLSFTLLVGLVLSSACTKRFNAKVRQPNPLLGDPNEVLWVSETASIYVRDMDLPRTMKLKQSAKFSVVSRDRLRFHVTIVHKWQEMADVTGWHATLVDDKGNVYEPETKELSKNKFVTDMWDVEHRTKVSSKDPSVATRAASEGAVVVNQFGDPDPSYDNRGQVASANANTYRNISLLSSFDVFKGSGDFTFFHEDIFTTDVKEITLILERGGVEYRFTWQFVEEDELAPDYVPDGVEGDEGDGEAALR